MNREEFEKQLKEMQDHIEKIRKERETLIEEMERKSRISRRWAFSIFGLMIAATLFLALGFLWNPVFLKVGSYVQLAGNIGVFGYLIWVKEYSIGKDWRETPLHLKFAWWGGLLLNMFFVASPIVELVS